MLAHSFPTRRSSDLFNFHRILKCDCHLCIVSFPFKLLPYKEFFPYFEGTAPLDACTEKLKQASRNYAKRQLTWFRHMDGVVWLDASAPDVTARAVQLTRKFLAKG